MNIHTLSVQPPAEQKSTTTPALRHFHNVFYSFSFHFRSFPNSTAGWAGTGAETKANTICTTTMWILKIWFIWRNILCTDICYTYYTFNPFLIFQHWTPSSGYISGEEDGIVYKNINWFSSSILIISFDVCSLLFPKMPTHPLIWHARVGFFISLSFMAM